MSAWTSSGCTVHTYDGANRFESGPSENTTDWSQTYGYDARGNRWVSANSGVSLSSFTARESQHDSAFPLWALANLWESQEEWDKAQVLYEQALALEPDDAVGNMNFGRMLKKKSERAAAKVYLARAVFLDPKYEAAKSLLTEVDNLRT